MNDSKWSKGLDQLFIIAALTVALAAKCINVFVLIHFHFYTSYSKLPICLCYCVCLMPCIVLGILQCHAQYS